MKLITIPPYKALNYTPEKGRFVELELLENMRRKGQIEGVEMDVDDGHDLGHRREERDEEFAAQIALGVLSRVRVYCDSGKYDAIICIGSILGFTPSRQVSKIPVVSAVHSAYHVASLIGERFSVIEATDPQALIARHFAQLYGFDHKLASVRSMAHSSTSMTKLIRDYRREDRSKAPEFKSVVDDIVGPCVKAIEEDRADSIILSCTPIQCFEEPVRQRLNELGYEEIQLITQFAAAVEMAKVMVNLKLVQAPVAYPSVTLKTRPKFR
jgi:Asp/Glu/hydantoin racemase